MHLVMNLANKVIKSILVFVSCLIRIITLKLVCVHCHFVDRVICKREDPKALKKLLCET